jgi:hypothetical protein
MGDHHLPATVAGLALASVVVLPGVAAAAEGFPAPPPVSLEVELADESREMPHAPFGVFAARDDLADTYFELDHTEVRRVSVAAVDGATYQVRLVIEDGADGPSDGDTVPLEGAPDGADWRQVEDRDGPVVLDCGPSDPDAHAISDGVVCTTTLTIDTEKLGAHDTHRFAAPDGDGPIEADCGPCEQNYRLRAAGTTTSLSLFSNLEFSDGAQAEDPARRSSAEPGGTAAVSYSGFAPASEVTVTFAGEQTVVIADDDGNVHVDVDVPEGEPARERASVLAVGETPDGREAMATAEIDVAAPGPLEGEVDAAAAAEMDAAGSSYGMAAYLVAVVVTALFGSAVTTAVVVLRRRRCSIG